MPIRKIACPLLLLLMLSGCAGAGRSAEGNIEVINATSAKMTCTRFDGERHYTAELTRPTAIAVEVKTDGGTLTLEIREQGQESIYSGNITSDFSFTVNAQPGTYQITAAGENHTGSYSFDWSGT
ncbi:MAG: hypothetical protein ACI3XG_11730 [Faecousia sp.]